MIFNEHTTVTLKDLSYNDVQELAAWCREAASYAGHRYKVFQAAAEKARHLRDLKRDAELEPKRLREEKIFAWLKANVKPGDRLKMKGCKDGNGIREFIKWDDDDNLVCWQISINRHWKPDNGIFTYTETKTNFVTTHMPDKVVWIQIKGQRFSPKKLIS